MSGTNKDELIKMNSHSPAAPKYFTGLTRREMIAMHAMASLINHHSSAGNYGFNAKEAAMSAVECADALLEELSK